MAAKASTAPGTLPLRQAEQRLRHAAAHSRHIQFRAPGLGPHARASRFVILHTTFRAIIPYLPST